MFTSFFLGLLLVKCVSGQTCTSNSVYVAGADDTLGFAGGASQSFGQFPRLDGCYTFESSLSVSDEFVFSKEGLDKDGPQISYVKDGATWNLSQMEYDGDYYNGIGEYATAISSVENPADVTNWIYDNMSANIVVRCGCDNTSPFEEPVTCKMSWISDGQCDTRNNNADCDYDGGDCCECTCTEERCSTQLSFHCLDPEVDCGSDSETSLVKSALIVFILGTICVISGFCFILLLVKCCGNEKIVSKEVDVGSVVYANGYPPMVVGVRVDPIGIPPI